MAVVIANYVTRGLGERRGAKDNIRYIQQRPGRDKEKLTRTLFGAAGIMGRSEAYQFINEAPTGTLFYRFKLSPDPKHEDTRRDLHMQKLTRQMMQSLEKRLTIALPWAGALHDDHTNIRHVHVLAALPRRLYTDELEALIREATKVCVEQRLGLDFGEERLIWPERTKHQTTYQTVKTQKRTYHRDQMPAPMLRGSRSAPGHTSCTCPRCHFPQSHDRQTGIHSCVSCGRMLHKKRELSLQRRKGAGWERSR